MPRKMFGVSIKCPRAHEGGAFHTYVFQKVEDLSFAEVCSWYLLKAFNIADHVVVQCVVLNIHAG